MCIINEYIRYIICNISLQITHVSNTENSIPVIYTVRYYTNCYSSLYMNNKEIRPIDKINLTKEAIITENRYNREMTEYRTGLKLSMFAGNDVEEWVDNVRDCIEEIKYEYRASFIRQHIGESALISTCT